MSEILKHKAINGWRLFWLISAPMSIVMVVEMMGTDMSTGSGVSSMIGFSVRWAVPFIFLVVAASAVPVLFPGPAEWFLCRRLLLQSPPYRRFLQRYGEARPGQYCGHLPKGL